MTPKEIEAAAKPLRDVGAALGAARSALRHGRPAGIDLDALRDRVDGVVADLIAARREEVVRTLASRAGALADDLGALYSGMTLDVVALVGGLQGLKAGLDVVERLLLEEGERPAAA